MIEELLQSPSLTLFKQSLLQGQSVLVEELWNPTKALAAAITRRVTKKHVLILTGASQEEIRLFQDLPLFSDEPVVDFPAWETLPSEKIPPSPDIVGERYKALKEVSQSAEPYIIISGLQACLQRLIPPKSFQMLHLVLKKGETVPFQGLINKLTEMGYKKSPVVSDKGEFAVRGGIIDLFPVSSPDPFRIEFWGDDIDSIRIFDPVGQKSIRMIDEAQILPAQEQELLQKSKKTCTILDYLGKDTIIIFDDLLALEDRYAALSGMLGGPTPTFCGLDEFLKEAGRFQTVYWSQTPLEELSQVQVLKPAEKGYYSESAQNTPIAFEMFNRKLEAIRWRSPFITLGDWLFPDHPTEEKISGQEILAALGKLSKTAAILRFFCATEAEEANLKQRIQDAGISLPKKVHFGRGYLSGGFVIRDLDEIILPFTEISGRYRVLRRKQRSTYHTSPTETYDLAPGDFVVHYHHGIGKFLGIEKKPNIQGLVSEYFAIEFAEKSKIFVPMNQAHLISKYVGGEDEIPKMHTLGSGYWKRTRERTERAIMNYAKDLLDLYAMREVREGFVYPEDSSDIGAFEGDFPYIETEDQLEAISQIKSDMQSKKSMDRLVCGDVGYGKTEVAMRAAFKAVVDGGKQVALLVPTTVLAMQHFDNFVDRMGNFPINIGVLSRFRTAKQIRETLEGIAEGSIDILIGTHRIISKDIRFKDLGLVIIDEEQRFGVKAKEHLKKIKSNVDCLTLSATPIPRTLYMSLVGVRDMSVINSPPQDRLPITTVISQGTDQALKNALLRELARDGQAYVIHNRVESIYDMASRIKKLLPQARVLTVHGQMHSDEIDTVFHTFKSGQADILVATTIIENGIDIPNANTILVDRADRFGLADLYQIRGRVGRWNRKAYAYFLVPSQRTLPEISRKRLNALMQASGYGGGMKLAMHDLEIRGAGNILGHEQSGHVSAIGFKLYCKLLKRTIQAFQGKIPGTLADTRMEFPGIDARLPEEYINEVSLRMEIYQRLGEALEPDEIDQVWGEVQDRFGKPPLPALWLYHLSRIRCLASRQGITQLRLETYSFSIIRRQGKEETIRKVQAPKFQTPAEFEAKIAGLLG